jgi:hypothetical protein
MIEAVSTSETPVSLYQTTQRNTPEDNHLHARHRENLISHNWIYVVLQIIFSGCFCLHPNLISLLLRAVT